MLQSIADAKEFSIEAPLDAEKIAANCAQPTCKAPPCRGCRPTCRESINDTEILPTIVK